MLAPTTESGVRLRSWLGAFDKAVWSTKRAGVRVGRASRPAPTSRTSSSVLEFDVECEVAPSLPAVGCFHPRTPRSLCCHPSPCNALRIVVTNEHALEAAQTAKRTDTKRGNHDAFLPDFPTAQCAILDRVSACAQAADVWRHTRQARWPGCDVKSLSVSVVYPDLGWIEADDSRLSRKIGKDRG